MQCVCCGEAVEDLAEHREECPDLPATTSKSPDWGRFDGPLFGPGANASRRE